MHGRVGEVVYQVLSFSPKGGSIGEVFINYEHQWGLSILTLKWIIFPSNLPRVNLPLDQDTLKPTSCFASSHDGIARPPSSPPLLCWRLFPICHIRRHSNLVHYLATTIETATKTNTLHGKLGSGRVGSREVTLSLNCSIFFQSRISKAFTWWKFMESTV